VGEGTREESGSYNALHVQDETDKREPLVTFVIALSGNLGIDKKMSKEELTNSKAF